MARTLALFSMVVLVLGCANAQEELEMLIAPGTTVEVLGTGYGFCEGPAADAEGNIYFSDGKKNSIHLYKHGETVELFVDDSVDSNGMIFNKEGELLVCEGAAYQIVAFDVKTKEKRVIVGEGERQYNEPNDLTVDSTGGFYFSDPNFAHHNQALLKKEDVYYATAEGEVTTVSTVCRKPNGVLLSADEKTLYVADYGGRAMYTYDVVAPGKLENEKKWADLAGSPDGLALDTKGNLYIALGPAGIHIYNPEGERIEALSRAQGVRFVSNLTFGGPDFKTLYFTSVSQFCAIPMQVEGVKPLAIRE